ncbi:MAG: hypothetical protein Q9168_008429, partial [Polycauliona sp. 1 TL-2023]
MRTSASSVIFLLMALATAVFANPFWARQDEPAEDPTAAAAVSSVLAADTSASATPTAVTSSASTSGTAPPASTTNTDSTAAASSTTNGTAAATSGSSTSSSVEPTPTVSCHKSSSTRPDDQIQNPFCEPPEGKHLVVGENYPLTWDPLLFKFDSTISITLMPVVSANADGETNNTVIWRQDGVRNEKGQVDNFQIHEADFKDFNLKNDTKLTLFIDSDPSDQPVQSGPTLILVVNDELAKNSTKNGSNNHIGEKAGIPVGLGLFLIAVAGLVFWFLRRRRNKSAG